MKHFASTLYKNEIKVVLIEKNEHSFSISLCVAMVLDNIFNFKSFLEVWEGS